MSSTVRIDAACAVPGLATVGTVFAGGWMVNYDWGAVPDRVVASGTPTRIPFPAPFDRDLAGVVLGQAAFADFQYIFKDGQYLRIRLSDGQPDGPAADTAPNWDLPADWTSVDAVFAGGGTKNGFLYFFRGDEYCRFDWATNARSTDYPRKIGPHWHATGDFALGIDGSITGQAGFGSKAYLLRTTTLEVNEYGHLTPPGVGGLTVSTPVYARYDYDTEAFEFTVTDPVQVVALWRGLLPLLDAGEATDIALGWVRQTRATLATGPPTPATAAAFSHHFATGASLDPAVLATVTANLLQIERRLESIPDRFQWTPGLGFPAQTTQGTLTEVGDSFCTFHGPNGRAAALIHESVHFTFGSGPDIPEWSGATIAGRTVEIAKDPATGDPMIAYSALTTAAALTNPSSYAALAQEVALGEDKRFGAGRPQE